MPRKRLLLILIVAGLIALTAIYAFLPKPVLVDAVKVVKGPMSVSISQEGKTRVKDSYVISAPIMGELRRIGLEVGDPVREGQTVAVIEPPRPEFLSPRSRAEAEAAVAAARASLSAAQAKATAAQANAKYLEARYERMKQLYAKGAISRNELENIEAQANEATANYLSARFEVKTASSQLEQAQAVLRYSPAQRAKTAAELVPVRAPVAGQILNINRKSAGVVNAGEPLLTVGNPGMLEVQVDVLSSDAVKIRPGMPVIMEQWGRDLPLRGRVQRVEPEGFTKVSALGVEEQRVWVIVDFTSPPELWRQLGDGYRLIADFIIWSGESVLQVPASSLFRYQNGWAVFLIEEKKARLRQVQIGHRSGLTAEILSGLREGDLVINHPSREIQDGTRIRLR